MSRKPPAPSFRLRSPRLTADQAAQIKAMLQLKMMQHDIAAQFGVNQGRVSEINTGRLFPDVLPAADSGIGI